MRVAALDCGTNSLRLLVADIDARTGSFTDVAFTGSGTFTGRRLEPQR